MPNIQNNNLTAQQQPQMGTAYRSPRLSPLHSFDSMI